MKKRIALMALFFALALGMGTVYGSEAVGATAPAYSVTISFEANGGTGAMASQTVSSAAGASGVSLMKNAFTKAGYTFTGWKDKNGTSYADQQNIAQLASAANNGQTLVLYAQWLIDAPKLKKLKPTAPGAMKITYSKNTAADSYELQYSTSSKFKKKTVVALKKGTSSVAITDFVPGKTYYVRIRSYVKSPKQHSGWSNVLKKKTKKGSTLVNTKASTGIEADITMTGSGSGYHAKLGLVTPESAVSYGIQFDQHAIPPYTGKAMAMIENVISNAPGQQQYSRPGNKSLKVGKKYHFMLTIDKKGKGNVYLNYKKIGSFSNPRLANTAVYPRVEAAVRLNGDSVKAVFDNIRMTRGNELQKGLFPNATIYKSNKGIKIKRTKNQNKVTISGRGVGINGDWDSDYEGVSGVYQF